MSISIAMRSFVWPVEIRSACGRAPTTPFEAQGKVSASPRMKLRSAPLDDCHIEALVWLDDSGRPWAHHVRTAVNGLYRVHRGLLMLIIRFCWKRTLSRPSHHKTNLEISQ
jgi:hypothetical protein